MLSLADIKRWGVLRKSGLVAAIDAALGSSAWQGGAGGGGSALPTAVAWSTTWTTAGNLSMPTQTVSGALALVSSQTGSIDGGSTVATLIAATATAPTVDGVALSPWVNGATHLVVLERTGLTVGWAANTLLAPSAIAAPVAPAWPSAPAIASATVGVATSYTGSPTGAPTPTLTYQWTLNGANIAGATAATYAPVSGNAGGALRVVVTATNASGSAVGTSNAVTVAAAATVPAAPTISGATSITATGLTYAWADGGNGGSAVTARNADISFDGGSTWAAIAGPTVGSNTITFASSGSARTAQIRGRATNAVGAGAYYTLAGISVPAASSGPGALPATAVAAQWQLGYAGASASTMDAGGVVTTTTSGSHSIGRVSSATTGDIDVAVRFSASMEPSDDGINVSLYMFDAPWSEVYAIRAQKNPAAPFALSVVVGEPAGGLSGTATLPAVTAYAPSQIVRIKRVGGVITPWYSVDNGATYTQLGDSVANTQNLHAGARSNTQPTTPTQFTYAVYAS